MEIFLRDVSFASGSPMLGPMVNYFLRYDVSGACLGSRCPVCEDRQMQMTKNIT